MTVFVVTNLQTGLYLGENSRGKQCWVAGDSGDVLVFEYCRQADDAVKELPRRLAKSIKNLRVVQADLDRLVIQGPAVKGGAA